MFLSSIHTLKPDEQVVTEAYGQKSVQNGPGVIVSNPFHGAEVRQVPLLGPLQYAIVKNTVSGEPRCEAGPKLLFLGAYDEVVGIHGKIALKRDEYVKLVDKETGNVRVVTGAEQDWQNTETPGGLVPKPTEENPAGVQKGVFLTKYQSIRLLESTT